MPKTGTPGEKTAMFRKSLFPFIAGALALCAVHSSDALAAPTTRDVTLTNIIEQLVPTRVLKGDREFDGHGPQVTSTVNVKISDDGRRLEARVYLKAQEVDSSGRETGDGSLTKAEWTRTVYTAPEGRRITRIVGALEDGNLIASPACIGLAAGRCVSSTTSFHSQRADFQFLMPTESWVQWIETIGDLVEQLIEAEQQLNDRDEPTPEERDALEVLRRVEDGASWLPSQGNHVHLEAPDNEGPVQVFAIVGDTGGPDISTDNVGTDDTRINSIMFRKLRVELE